MKKSNEGRTDNPIGEYSIIWKYKIKPESTDRFEHEYGSKGSWFKLFSKSEHYRGSFLHKTDDEENIYILIDKWADKQSYEDFKNMNADTYNELSSKFETLYDSEERVGAFIKTD